jgi:hypothetical protein
MKPESINRAIAELCGASADEIERLEKDLAAMTKERDDAAEKWSFYVEGILRCLGKEMVPDEDGAMPEECTVILNLIDQRDDALAEVARLKSGGCARDPRFSRLVDELASHIRKPFTASELCDRLESGDYSAELLMQHLLLIVRGDNGETK